MTASKYIKDMGLPNLVYVADMVNKHPDTIHNWYRNNYALFEAVVAWSKAKKKEQEEAEAHEADKLADRSIKRTDGKRDYQIVTYELASREKIE